jgi:two-component system sensor histidine kinase PilS (NtrC family)
VYQRPTSDSAQPATLPHHPVLRIYLAYRGLLSLVFLLLAATPDTRSLLGNLNPVLYSGTAIAFLVSTVALMAVPSRRWRNSQSALVLLFSIDILCIISIADASGGMRSGLPLLLIITVASSAVVLLQRLLATLVAALAVLAVLVDTAWLISTGYLDVNDSLPAGLLGMLLFVVSALVQLIAARLGRAEALAERKSFDLYNLQRLNEEIVQSLELGILLVGEDDRVRVLNRAAANFLGGPERLREGTVRVLGDYSQELRKRLVAFRERGAQSRVPFRLSEDGVELVPRFRGLSAGVDRSGKDTLIFLEDYTPVTQSAQLLKLGSLGRLTASIAHEIRNPLGAISHAAQLMSEDSRSGADQRMLDIILTNSRRVNEIVESVLQISRREPPRPQVLALESWLERELERYQSTRDSHCTIDWQCTPGLTMEFDPEHLQRVLDNLLDNALRHSALANASAWAQLHAFREGDTIIIDVMDDGRGVAAEDVERLFEPFFTRARGGSGMGLYLCRELCELNQANLLHHAREDGRTCFRISLSDISNGIEAA